MPRAARRRRLQRRFAQARQIDPPLDTEGQAEHGAEVSQ